MSVHAPAVLYHYTSGDYARRILCDGVLRPWPMMLLPRARLVWLTDLAEPDRDALGLSMNYIDQDRTEYRCTVANIPGTIYHWPAWARRNQVPRVTREVLETGAFPMHWWVAETRLPVYDITATRSGVSC